MTVNNNPKDVIPALECDVCNELYRPIDERLVPHSLNCGHTFCHSCINGMVEHQRKYSTAAKPLDLNCPICKATHPPDKLPEKNYLAIGLIEEIARLTIAKPVAASSSTPAAPDLTKPEWAKVAQLKQEYEDTCDSYKTTPMHIDLSKYTPDSAERVYKRFLADVKGGKEAQLHSITHIAIPSSAPTSSSRPETPASSTVDFSKPEWANVVALKKEYEEICQEIQTPPTKLDLTGLTPKQGEECYQALLTNLFETISAPTTSNESAPTTSNKPTSSSSVAETSAASAPKQIQPCFVKFKQWLDKQSDSALSLRYTGGDYSAPSLRVYLEEKCCLQPERLPRNLRGAVMNIMGGLERIKRINGQLAMAPVDHFQRSKDEINYTNYHLLLTEFKIHLDMIQQSGFSDDEIASFVLHSGVPGQISKLREAFNNGDFEKATDFLNFENRRESDVLFKGCLDQYDLILAGVRPRVSETKQAPSTNVASASSSPPIAAPASSSPPIAAPASSSQPAPIAETSAGPQTQSRFAGFKQWLADKTDAQLSALYGSDSPHQYLKDKAELSLEKVVDDLERNIYLLFNGAYKPVRNEGRLENVNRVENSANDLKLKLWEFKLVLDMLQQSGISSQEIVSHFMTKLDEKMLNVLMKTPEEYRNATTYDNFPDRDSFERLFFECRDRTTQILRDNGLFAIHREQRVEAPAPAPLPTSSSAPRPAPAQTPASSSQQAPVAASSNAPHPAFEDFRSSLRGKSEEYLQDLYDNQSSFEPNNQPLKAYLEVKSTQTPQQLIYTITPHMNQLIDYMGSGIGLYQLKRANGELTRADTRLEASYSRRPQEQFIRMASELKIVLDLIENSKLISSEKVSVLEPLERHIERLNNAMSSQNFEVMKKRYFPSMPEMKKADSILKEAIVQYYIMNPKRPQS